MVQAPHSIHIHTVPWIGLQPAQTKRQLTGMREVNGGAGHCKPRVQNVSQTYNLSSIYGPLGGLTQSMILLLWWKQVHHFACKIMCKKQLLHIELCASLPRSQIEMSLEHVTFVSGETVNGDLACLNQPSYFVFSVC